MEEGAREGQKEGERERETEHGAKSLWSCIWHMKNFGRDINDDGLERQPPQPQSQWQRQRQRRQPQSRSQLEIQMKMGNGKWSRHTQSVYACYVPCGRRYCGELIFIVCPDGTPKIATPTALRASSAFLIMQPAVSSPSSPPSLSACLSCCVSCWHFAWSSDFSALCLACLI